LDEGHEVANHAWNHPVLSKISYDEVSKQLQSTNKVLKQAINSNKGTNQITTMRPPYGNTNKKLNNYIQLHENLTVVMWSYDTNDWKRPGHTVILDPVLKNVKAGDVILCHDIHPGTIEAVPYIIDTMQSRGYAFASVKQMISLEDSLKKKKKLL